MVKKKGDSTVPNVGPTPTLADPNKLCKRSHGPASYAVFVSNLRFAIVTKSLFPNIGFYFLMNYL